MNVTAHYVDSIVADAYFPALRDHIISSTGLVYFASRPQLLAGHVAERLRSHGLGDCREYWELLQDEQSGETELDQLIALLTIGETYFFRHRELFDALRDVALPEIVERNRQSKRIRIWSAGCSTGPEAYSVSILLRREFGAAIQGWNVSIVGTDINRPFLAQAAEGRYEEWAFRGTTPAFRHECFEEEGQSWRIAARFRQGVSFQYHNLARHPFPSLVHNLVAFDLILCRNVLIYFAQDIAGRIVSALADCLVPNGWLAIGHAEHGSHMQASFEAVSCNGATLYRKVNRDGGLTLSGLRCHHPEVSIRNGSSPIKLGSQSIKLNPAARDGAEQIPCRIALPPAARIVTPHERASCAEIEQIKVLADRGELGAALKLTESMIARNRLHPIGYYYQALLFDQTEGHEAALKALGKAVYLDRDFELAHYYMGLTYHKLGRVADAVRSFHNVLERLDGRSRCERLPNADGMTVADLDELTHIQLESLEAE